MLRRLGLVFYFLGLWPLLSYFTDSFDDGLIFVGICWILGFVFAGNPLRGLNELDLGAV